MAIPLYKICKENKYSMCQKKGYTKVTTARERQLCGFLSRLEALFLACFWFELCLMNTNNLCQLTKVTKFSIFAYTWLWLLWLTPIVAKLATFMSLETRPWISWISSVVTSCKQFLPDTHNVNLHKCCLRVVTSSRELRVTFFDVYCSFVPVLWMLGIYQFSQ